MKDIGRALLAKTDTIVESWIELICQQIDIESAKKLTYQAVRDSIPLVVRPWAGRRAGASLLSESLEDRTQQAENEGLEHGMVRAEQGYDAAEIVREYRLLRQVIFSVLEPDLLSGSTAEALYAVKAIDSVLDQVISFSIESYVEARLQELEQVRGELKLTNQELSRLVKTQKDNLSHLAHELKNPLNSIMGFSSLILQQQQRINSARDSSSLNLQLIERVLQNSRQLLGLINNTLEISRYEAGQIQLNLEQINLVALISMTVEALEPSARQKDLEIIIDCDRAPEQITTDTLRLQQIITNLVSNAIRYTELGAVQIVCQTQESDRWSLVVADTGIGISPEDRARIFQPYYRVGSKENYLPNSTGLGLTIVEQLVKLLQGEISLVSQVGQGSTFTIVFPRSYTDRGNS